MRIAVTTREWPPEVYGGAGVHVTELVHAMKPYVDVDVYCMGAPREDAKAFQLRDDDQMNMSLKVVAADVEIAREISLSQADVAHSHTWYAVLAGHLGAATKGIPHIVTAHSLEPHRPWKAEQLGGGYTVSSWVERECYRAAAGVVAVSTSTRADVLDVYPRKVCFLPASGKAMVKRLAPTQTESIAALDRAAAQKAVPQATGGGSVDLF